MADNSESPTGSNFQNVKPKHLPSFAETHYVIDLKAGLDSHWSSWLGGMQITYDVNGNTRLSGIIPDQAALHGILVKIRDLGMTILSLKRIEVDE